MKCYLTTIGEVTTEICKKQLESFGFEVILLDEKEPWIDKYKRFINLANDDCIRIDADVIPNKHITELKDTKSLFSMIQVKGFDIYLNDIKVMSPVLYRKKALDIIRRNIGLLDKNRPETSAWRLPELNKDTQTLDIICGVHGLNQRKEDIERHIQHRKERKQEGGYY
jgi:hypothetical protein